MAGSTDRSVRVVRQFFTARCVTEKATGEKYKSKVAMAKHEKKEGKTVQKKEKFDFMKMIKK